MSLPVTKYINAGPMQAQANAGPAMAAGQAMAQVGNAIANVGEQGLELLGKTRRIKEGGAIAAFMANAQETAGSFANELARRSDTDAWVQDWKNKAEDLNQQSKALGLSPEGMASLSADLTGWQSKQSINFETQALSKSLGIAHAQAGQALDYHAARGDKTQFDRTLGHAVDAGIYNPAEVEKANLNFKEQEAAQDIQRGLQGNPKGMIDIDPQEILDRMPGATLQMVEQGKQQAKGLVKERSRDAGELAMDEIADSKITDPEQLKTDERFKAMRPAMREHLEGVMQARAAEGYKEKVATPEFQQQAYGMISAGIFNYNAEADDSDLQLAQIDSAMRDVKPGFLKDQLKSQYKELVANKGLPEAKTYGDYVRNQVDELAKAGRFGKTITEAQMPKLQTADLVKQGFLKDPEKLQRLGFDAKQASTIVEAAKTDPGSGQGKLSELWSKRDAGNVKASPIEVATADALRGGHSSIDWNDPAKSEAAIQANLSTAQKYGSAKRKITEFLKLNPKASKEEVDKEFLKVTGEGIRAEAKQKLVAPRPLPGETSMNAPSGTRLTAFGYPGDTTPDSNSKKGIAAFTTEADAQGSRSAPTRLRPGDFALSPDMEKKMRAAGVSPRDEVTLKLADGSTHRGRWMDRTADYLTGRVDIYSPTGIPKNDNTGVVSFTL